MGGLDQGLRTKEARNWKSRGTKPPLSDAVNEFSR